MRERLQPKNLIEKPSRVWVSIVRSINQGSNKWANQMFDDMAPVFLTEVAAALDGYERKFSARDHFFYAYLGVTRGIPYRILAALADKTGGRYFDSRFTYKPQ